MSGKNVYTIIEQKFMHRHFIEIFRTKGSSDRQDNAIITNVT